MSSKGPTYRLVIKLNIVNKLFFIEYMCSINAGGRGGDENNDDGKLSSKYDCDLCCLPGIAYSVRLNENIWSFKVLTTEKVIIFPARLINSLHWMSLRHARGHHALRKTCLVSWTFPEKQAPASVLSPQSPQFSCTWTFAPFLLPFADASFFGH